jgi:putative tryptophan/tyrosine transport system substrate-binding protein
VTRIIWLLLVFFAFCNGAQAQQPKKVARIGYLSNTDRVRESARAEAILRALRDLGYVEGQNIATEYRYAEGKSDRYPKLAADLVKLKVDIIVVAGGSGPVGAAKNATTTIPIIMIGIGLDPVEAGLVKSLARPGGNITGVTNLSGELAGKRLELLKEAVPKLARVAVLYNPNTRSNIVELKEDIPAAARALGLTVEPWEIRASDDFERIFAAINKQRPDGFYKLQGVVRTSSYQQIVDFALKSRLPSMYATREYVDAGGLMYYGADLPQSYRLVAAYVDKMLKGAKPADLPIEQPTKFELMINLQAAKQIGLTIPPNVLARANKVIR